VAQSIDEGPEVVGDGENLFRAGEVRGEVRWFRTLADVVSAVDNDDLTEIVAFVYQGGMTFLSPILAEVKAVVCTTGSLESHLALLARELEMPCIMGARLDVVLSDGDGVVLDLDGLDRARIRRLGPGVRPATDLTVLAPG
jgi:phosphohistidine swiveling domain-containing protein